MTLCPVALAVGCERCPAFSICPLKSVLGDAPTAPAAPDPGPASGAGGRRRRGKGGRKSR